MDIDFTPLRHPITHKEIQAYRKHALSAKTVGSRMLKRIAERENQPLYISIALAFIGPVVVMYGLAAVTGDTASAVATAGVLTPFGFIVAIAVGWWIKPIINNRIWEHRMRLEKFAQVNSLLFIEEYQDFFYPGMMTLSSGARSSRLYNCIRVTEEPRIEWGNYESHYEHTAKRIINYGYVAIQLDRHMPHMIVDSRTNNWRSFGVEESNIAAQFKGAQQLQLEGDFANHFTLYVPSEYKTDAYYIFTPDFMAELVDEAGDFDVEIIDNYMFLYRSTPFEQYTPELVDKIFRVISVVGSKALLRSNRYKDIRIIQDTPTSDLSSIATEGRRLQRSTTMRTFVVVAIWVSALFIVAGVVMAIIDALYL